MITHIPKVLYENKITEVLDDIRYQYGKLTRKGYIYGLIAIDQDAKIIAIDGNFDQALSIVRSLTQKHPVTLVNSLNPHRIEGQKTAAFEIVDELGDAPDYLFIPVGNAGNITAYWKGFSEYHHKTAAGESGGTTQ